MYAQLEAAGLIRDTEEWKEAQAQKYRKMMEQGGESDADRQKDPGQALLFGRLLQHAHEEQMLSGSRGML